CRCSIPTSTVVPFGGAPGCRTAAGDPRPRAAADACPDDPDAVAGHSRAAGGSPRRCRSGAGGDGASAVAGDRALGRALPRPPRVALAERVSGRRSDPAATDGRDLRSRRGTTGEGLAAVARLRSAPSLAGATASSVNPER